MVLVRVSLEAGREVARAGWSMRLSQAGSDRAPVPRRHELDLAFTRRNRALSAHAR